MQYLSQLHSLFGLAEKYFRWARPFEIGLYANCAKAH
jgi:hypothetical protein